MFTKIEQTQYPPSQHTLLWDGDCGFCKFWKTRWEQKTKGVIFFETYQKAASNFPDIPLKEFKKASRLIEKDGRIYSGPDSAYRSMWHAGTKYHHELYQSNSFFRKFSDHTYNHIAKNRNLYFKVTKLLFGNNPLKLRPYWLLYIFIILAIIFL